MLQNTNFTLQAAQKKQVAVALLNHYCQLIEITDSQYQTAKSRYETLGYWLSTAASSHLYNAKIYPQGSIALGTINKPITGNEFDVDLVCHLPTLSHSSDAHAVKALIGARLREHATYNGMLEEKQRCWRINYANEFHLDITPSIGNPYCYQGGELVPDKSSAIWKATNPKGYISKFEEYAAINPRIYQAETLFGKVVYDSIDPLPKQTLSKPILKRIVQLLKRHRDYHYVGKTHADLAPISIIITTLAGWSYKQCTLQQTYQNDFDFISAVIHEMPKFIQIDNRFGKPFFIINNETTSNENFADKWNENPDLAAAFYKWHSDVCSFIKTLVFIEGVDCFANAFANNLGAKRSEIQNLFTDITDQINQARLTGQLAIAPSFGLTTSPSLGSVKVPKNTFYGR